MYKDPDKQREANRKAQARFKAKQSLAEQGITEKVLPLEPKSVSVIPKPERTDQGNIRVSKPGDADYEPQCETTRAFIEGITDKALPSGQHTETYDSIQACKRANLVECGVIAGPSVDKPKRGKDITCFKDLSPHVQETIDMMSMVDGKIDKTVKANRTAIAVNYQHLFPDRFHSTGVI